MTQAQAVEITELKAANAELAHTVVDLLRGPETVENEGDPQGAAWDRVRSKARTAVIKLQENE